MAEPTISPVLNQILVKADEARKNSLALRDREVANALAAEEIISAAIVDVQKIGQAKTVEATARATGEMVAQDQARSIISQAQGFETLAGLLEKSTAVAKEVAVRTDVVRKEKETRLIDDPLTWIKSAVDWDNNEKKLIGAVDQLQTIHGAAQSIGNQIGVIGTQSRANAKVITDASIQAQADRLEAEASLQAAQLRLDGLKYNTQGVQAVAAASDRDLKLATDVANFGRAEAQYQLALEEEARRREQFNWQREQARAIRDEKISEKQFEERTVQYIQLGEAARGITPSSPQMIKDMIKLNKGLTQEYIDLYKNGEIASRTGQGIIAETPAKVLSILSRDPTLIAQLPEQQKKVAEILLNAQAVLGDKSVRAKEGLDDDKTGTKSSRVVTQAVQTQIQRALAYVGNNPDNVFYIGDPSSYIGSKESPGVSAFQRYPLTGIVFNPAIEAGIPLSDPTIPWKLTLEAVKAGKINSSQAAADFSQIYKRMSALHRAGVDFKKFAIALPPDGASYRVKIGGEIVDVTDFPAVARAMNAELARQAVRARYDQIKENRGNAIRNLPGSEQVPGR